ncbi:hypothetical protein BJ875DRAFT_379717 [Amylocarpus encephaloides]|uniref:Uncharacterized protein n=1 Tax=Amylocarpus encephaloides TaxID=45428 RepID=A0A9P7YH55_9HELO|nr:hypothetical protein BJ875DRAFT_379717 [Amylocarpus encephaloides]
MEELFGCWQEARRADKISARLLVIRTELDEFYGNITAVLKEVESSSRLLRDLYDLFPIYRSRVAMVLYYLNVILPTMSRTMRDMTIYIDNDELPTGLQWTLMYQRIGDQGGMNLAQRFAMYCEALVQTVRLLSRSPLYDPTSLELLRVRHMRLRKLQGIPDPRAPIIPHRAQPQPTQVEIERRHWAEKIYDDQPHSTTGLKHRRGSKCFGPPMVESRLGIPSGSAVLFKLPFDKNRLSVTLYLHADGADVTRILCRWMDRFYNPLYSCYGVHELCVRRKGASLQFRRWSNNRAHAKVWMALFFKTWESTYHPRPQNWWPTITCCCLEWRTPEMSLTQQSASPQWMHRKSKHRIWLKDITPYIFCGTYNKKHQMRKNGGFELYFVDRRAADVFEEIFQPEDSVPGSEGSHVIVVPGPSGQYKPDGFT